MREYIVILIAAISFFSCASSVSITSSPENSFVIHLADPENQNRTLKASRGIISPGSVQANFNHFNQFTFVKDGYCPCVRTYDGSGAPDGINGALIPITPIDHVEKRHTLGIANVVVELPPYTIINNKGWYKYTYYHPEWAIENRLHTGLKKQVRQVFGEHKIPFQAISEKVPEENIYEGPYPDARFRVTPYILDIWCSQKGVTKGCKLNVRWEVYDGELKKNSHIFYSIGGGTQTIPHNTNRHNRTDSVLRAMYNATECLINNPEFLDFMGTKYTSNKSLFIYEDPIHIPSVPALSPLEPGKTIAMDSFVSVRTEKGHGSGIILSESGYLLAPASLVYDTRVIEVRKHTGELAIAIPKRINRTHDVALLKIADAEGTRPIPLFSGHYIAGGKSIIVIRDNTANYGEPVLNKQGQLIGVTQKGNINDQHGEGFLLPVTKALNVLKVSVKEPEVLEQKIN